VGGVAHDFNNLLAVVEGNLDFLLEDLENRTIEVREQREIITNALSAARRGADLTRSLLAFARRSHLEPRTVDINDVVRETESWLGRALPVTIDRQTCLLDGGAVTTLDPTRLQSALVNIVVNARDAMADGGTLTILTERVEVGAGALDAGGGEIPPGDYLVLSVADTGAGIPPELLPRVFEPFVTSKEIGKGTGLGLSMVHGFVNQSGGFIRIRSQPGEGTTVELLFPASGESTEVPAAPPPGGESAAQAQLGHAGGAGIPRCGIPDSSQSRPGPGRYGSAREWGIRTLDPELLARCNPRADPERRPRPIGSSGPENSPPTPPPGSSGQPRGAPFAGPAWSAAHPSPGVVPPLRPCRARTRT
jgi:hypothetical protein